MPHRLVCLAILGFWVIAAASLFLRDVLPELIVGPPPDLRDISRAERPPGPTRWAIMVADDPSSSGNLRAVGRADTEMTLKKDGWVQFSSDVWFDSEGLLRGTPFETAQGEPIAVHSTFEIDPLGNLQHFRSGVRIAGEPAELLVLEGRLDQNEIVVTAQGPLPLLCWTRRFPYKARGMVQNTLGPIDRMPGLHVGQRWESKVVSPLTGQVETVRVEVARRHVIHWDKGPVTTLEVVTRMTGMTARTWVRPDGLVLRQEIPFPIVKLVLERLPDASAEARTVERPLP